MNEAGIIAACKKGDRSAQKTLFDAYSRGMLLLCTRYVQDRHNAEELMLNGFYKFFSTIGRFEYARTNSIGGWLSKIMVNECLMFLRKTDRITFVAETAAAEIVVDTAIWEQMDIAQLMELIHALPDGYRAVFNLYVIEGFSHKEIAELLQISEGTSKSQLSKARALLQKSLLQKGWTYERQY